MTNDVERQLMRLLHGELSPEECAGWRQRLAAEPELAAQYEAMERLWSTLDLPEPAPAGPELVAAVRRRLARQASPSLVDMWRLASTWNRLLAAAALAVGIGIGTVAGTVSTASADDSLLVETELTLAESYWLVIEDSGAEVDSQVEVESEVQP